MDTREDIFGELERQRLLLMEQKAVVDQQTTILRNLGESYQQLWVDIICNWNKGDLRPFKMADLKKFSQEVKEISQEAYPLWNIYVTLRECLEVCCKGRREGFEEAIKMLRENRVPLVAETLHWTQEDAAKFLEVDDESLRRRREKLEGELQELLREDD